MVLCFGIYVDTTILALTFCTLEDTVLLFVQQTTTDSRRASARKGRFAFSLSGQLVPGRYLLEAETVDRIISLLESWRQQHCTSAQAASVRPAVFLVCDNTNRFSC